MFLCIRFGSKIEVARNIIKLIYSKSFVQYIPKWLLIIIIVYLISFYIRIKYTKNLQSEIEYVRQN